MKLITYTLNGMGAVTHSSANVNGGLDHYYFFYNWQVRELVCVSPRVPVTVTVSVCTGINDLENTKISIYPNPATDVITIEGGVLNNSIKDINFKVMDVLGKVVLQDKIRTSKQIVNINNLEKGLYFILFNNGETVVKFVKQ